MILVICIVVYLIPGVAGTVIGWNSFEMYGSKWAARIVMTPLWPYFMLVLPLNNR